MAKVVYYSVHLFCPTCGRKGEAKARDFLGENSEYALASLTEGFVQVMGATTPRMALVRCECGAEFNA
jgi:hypothetical protein